MKHPNSYLPKYNVQSETDGETTPLNGKTSDSMAGSNTFESDEELDEDHDDQMDDGLFFFLLKLIYHCFGFFYDSRIFFYFFLDLNRCRRRR